MNHYLKLIIIFCIALFGGCSGHHCIKIGGIYEGAEAEIEYCWNLEKSKAAGVPVLEGGKKGDLYAIPEKDILGINKMLEKNIDKKYIGIPETAIITLKRLLDVWKKTKEREK